MAKKKAARKTASKAKPSPPAAKPQPKPAAESTDQAAVDRLTWQKQIAEELGVTVETVREWSRRPGFPQLGTADQVLAWKQAHVRSGGPPTKRQRETGEFDPFTSEGVVAAAVAKHENQLLKNEKIQEEIVAKRLANEIKRRNLISLPAVESFLRKAFSGMRSKVEGWPSEAVTALPGKLRQAAQDIFAEKVRLLLLEFAALEQEIVLDEEVMGDGHS